MANVLTVDDAYAEQIAGLLMIGRQTLPVRAVNATLGAGDWATVLVAGNTSGGTNPIISATDALVFDGAAQSATTGRMRVPQGWDLRGRNSADTSDVTLVEYGVSASNRLTVGEATGSVATLRLLAGTTVAIQPLGTNRLRVTSTFIELGHGDVRWTSGSVPELGQDSVAGAGATMTMQAQESTGAAGGDLELRGGVSGALTEGGDVLVAGGNGTLFQGNVAVHALPSSWNGAARTMFLANSPAIPAGNPVGGGYLYVDVAGNLVYRGPSGTVTVIAPP